MNEKIDFWEGLKDYDSEKVAEFMESDFKQRLELFIEKDASYGGSWQKDGLNGAFLNLKRKWDRLEHIFKKGKLFETSVENTEDTLKDLSNYATMFLFLYEQKLKLEVLESPDHAVAVSTITKFKSKNPISYSSSKNTRRGYADDDNCYDEDELG